MKQVFAIELSTHLLLCTALVPFRHFQITATSSSHIFSIAPLLFKMLFWQVNDVTAVSGFASIEPKSHHFSSSSVLFLGFLAHFWNGPLISMHLFESFHHVTAEQHTSFTSSHIFWNADIFILPTRWLASLLDLQRFVFISSWNRIKRIFILDSLKSVTSWTPPPISRNVN